MKNLKYEIQYKMQRAKKGYCDEDLFSIFDWFIEIFPKMLDEFADCSCGYPCNEEELKKEVVEFPKLWIKKQENIINEILKKYDEKFNIDDSMCCWLLIILRMKYCFEMCDEWNKDYNQIRERGFYEILNHKVEQHKKEGFYLFEKYFFNLWW